MNKISARDCFIKELDAKTVKEFLNLNHSQKSCNHSIAYGLIYKNELVQLMSFGKPRFNKNFDWELLRDCSKKDYVIRGGVSKLWKYFIEHNNVKSCICYSYPHDNKNMYTNKYINYCGFKNISKAKLTKKIYFEGTWNNEVKRIDKSILERHGVDRLLKTKQGQDRTNEQILLDLGFEKKEENGFDPQVDSYFPFGVLFRIDDLDDGSFYIGETTIKEKWENGYLGTGGYKWDNHKKKHPPIDKYPNNPEAHHYKRTLIKDDFKSPKDLFSAEVKEIRKYAEKDSKGKWKILDPNCKNVGCYIQGSNHKHNIGNYVCDECGGKNGKHRKKCSKYVKIPNCVECNGLDGKHKSWCSKSTKIIICKECGGHGGLHLDSCSMSKGFCEECGYSIQSNKHSPTCSKYRKINDYCEKCNSHGGKHKKDCEYYVEPKGRCEFCNTLPGGFHKINCPKYIEYNYCPECGYSLKSNKHAKTCSQYVKQKEADPCPKCGAKYGHTKECPEAEFYDCCGNSKQSKHHAKWCLNYNSKDTPLLVCVECKGVNDNHSKDCSHKGICNICNIELGRGSKHRKNCNFHILLNLINDIKSKKFNDLNDINKFISNSIDIKLTKSDLLMYRIEV